METLEDILNEAKKASNATSDADLSRKIGVTGATVSYWRSGRQAPDSYALMQLQGILKVDARELLAIIEKERAKTEERREYWDGVKKSFQKTTATALAGLTLLAVFGGGLSYIPLSCQMYIMSSWKRIKRAIRRTRKPDPFEFSQSIL